LIPGDAITLSYAPRAYGDLRCRIQSIEMPDPARPQLSIEFKLDRTYLLADLAVDGFFSPASVDAVEVDQIAAYSLVELPAPLCAEGRPSLGVLAARPSVLTSGFTVHLGQNYDSTLGLVAPTSFDLIGSWSSFALHGAIAEDYPLATEPIDVTTGMTVRLDGVDLEIDEQTVFSGLSDTLLVFAGTEIMSVVRADLVGIATYRLMLSRAQFGSIRAAHAAAEEVFIVFWSDLLALRHPLFEPFNVADVKLQASTGAGSADISLAPEPTLTFAGRVYAEPGPLNLRVGGNASAPTYGAGADLSIEWSVGDSGTLPWRLDAVMRTSVLRFYDATGVTLLGSLSTAASSATVLNAALIAILGSEVTFQLTVEITSESHWWTLTSPVTPKLTVTKV
jgi:hypothetical protein